MSQLKQVAAEQDGHKNRGIFGSPQGWLKEKAAVDQRIWGHDSGHWVVDNQEYDLTEFMGQHPGGKHWIQLTKGQNISQHFHLAKNALKQYHVKPTKSKAYRFSFQPDGLYETIRTRLLKQHTPQQLQDNSGSQRVAVVIVLGFLATLTLTGLYGSYIMALVTSLFMVALMGLGHNFMHEKKNWGRFLFEVSGLGHKEWTIFHAISHHLYPNTNIDYQVAVFEPLVYFLKTFPPNAIYTELLLQPFYLVMVPLNILLKMTKPLRGLPFDPWCLACLTQIPFFMYLGGMDLVQAVKLFVVFQGLFGFIMTKTIFCGHRQAKLWSEGDQRVQDFAEHTIISTSDNELGWNAYVSFMFFTGFNIHIAHHLFPTIDHSKLHLANRILREVLAQKGHHYNCSKKLECMVEYSKCVVTRTPFKADQ